MANQYLSTRVFVALCSVLVLMAIGLRIRDRMPEPDRDPRWITDAVFAHDRLWMLQFDHSLMSLGIGQAKPESVAGRRKVLTICKSGADLVAVVAGPRKDWVVGRQAGDGWRFSTTVGSDGDTLVAVDCAADGGDLHLTTSRRMITVGRNGTTILRIEPQLEAADGYVLATTTVDATWLGYNIGEWGGGLKRIDHASGHVSTVSANHSGGLCGGPLNTGCDPVNAMIVSPRNPRCIVAAIGLIHMSSHGRIIEVCGDHVRRIYFKRFDPQPVNGSVDDGEPSTTVAFYGLARSGQTIRAAGMDGLYRFDGNAPPRYQSLPKFEERDGYYVNFDDPTVALVLTDINQSQSSGGSVPLMATR
jgi:hypothetical protein